jgi:hypothetical protein
VATTRATDGGALPWYVEPTFGQRLTAAAVDGMLLIVGAIALTRVPVGDAGQRGLVWLVTALYFIGTIALTGRTLGKRALGLQVRSVRTGGLPGLGAATIRWAVVALPSIVSWFVPALGRLDPLILLVVYLPILQPPFHRGLHDHAAGTVVVAKAG